MFLNGKTLLYHGTAQAHDHIDISNKSGLKDFGRGYYLTSSMRQAQRWAERRGMGGKVCWVYVYSVQPPAIGVLRELPLLTYDWEWLETIRCCRLYGCVPPEIQALKKIKDPGGFDVVYDRIADGSLPDILNQYDRGEISVDDALRRIQFSGMLQHESDQYCFKTDRAISTLARQTVWKGTKTGGRGSRWSYIKEEYV